MVEASSIIKMEGTMMANGRKIKCTDGVSYFMKGAN